MRALIVSHAHPAFSIGGVESASYALFKALKELSGWEAHYLAGVTRPTVRHADTPLLSLGRGADETLFWHDGFDLANLSNPKLIDYINYVEPFFRVLAPDVIHLHHVLGFGLEIIWSLRRALPRAGIVMTLHEYLLMCANHGQMVKSDTGRPCSLANAVDCSRCFPDLGYGAMKRRELFVRRTLQMVDAFVGPSEFIVERFIDWGLPRERCTVIENAVEPGPIAPARPLRAPRSSRNRFGFFGQITPFKGLGVLLEAVERVPREAWGEDGGVVIHGGNLERQPHDFQREFEARLRRAGARVRFAGPYIGEDLPTLMRAVDWTIVPSTWWENSPVVIQESFRHRRPVICSGLGGMAEKVRNGVDGLHFRVGDAGDLARVITRAMTDGVLWERLRRDMRPVQGLDECVGRHVEVYEAVTSLPGTGAVGCVA